jgi:AcrR family transcriptional regulator
MASPLAVPASEPTTVERRDVTRNRAKLLAAADEEFAARGEEATIESIARRAGLGNGTAYRHFANKRALLQALFADRIDRILELLDEVCRLPDPGDALWCFLRDAAAMQACDRGLRDAIIASEGFEILTERLERLTDGVAALVERAKIAGAVRTDFEGTDVPIIFAAVGAVVDDTSDVDGELWRRYLEMILDGIRPLSAPRLPLPVPALDPAQLPMVMRHHQRRRNRQG